MKTVSSSLILWLALVCAVSAQTSGVTIEVTLDQEQYLPAEELRVGVRITNLSGRTLQLGEEDDWLTFSIESSGNFVVQKFENPPVAGHFSLDSSMTATKRVDIAPYFNLQKLGRYSIVAKVKTPQWDQEVASRPKNFNIMGGTKLRVIEFGVPLSADTASERPEIRKYILQQAQYGKEMKLYLRLTDGAEGKIYKVFPLARMVSFSQPEVQLDRFSNLHVLHQTGQKGFNYCAINPEGQIVSRQTHEYSARSRPRLRVQEDGRIGVSGGIRRINGNDLPPPDVTSLPATNVKNQTDAKNPKP